LNFNIIHTYQLCIIKAMYLFRGKKQLKIEVHVTFLP